MKRFLVVAALLAFAAPAAFAAPPAGKGKPDASTSSSLGQSSAALCKEQRVKMGMSAFRALYAPSGSPKAAMDACLAKVSTQVTTTFKNAAKECKDERGTTAESKQAFADTYGTNTNKRNAFGKCVSGKVSKQTEEQQEETLSAAKQCKKDKAENAQSFAGKYGSAKNAFGKCVSAKSKENRDSSDD
jgi:Tfp pilus assembly protein PilV